MMQRIGERNYELMLRGIQANGTYNPDEIFYAFEERLYVHESQDIYNFLKWVHEEGKTFGHGNYESVYKQYLLSCGEVVKMATNEDLSGTVSASIGKYGALTLKIQNCSMEDEFGLTIQETKALYEVLHRRFG
jgi:hypothetical protein